MDIKEFLKVMVENEASDVYLTAGSPPMYRIQGVTRPAGKTVLEGDAVKTGLRYHE